MNKIAFRGFGLLLARSDTLQPERLRDLQSARHAGAEREQEMGGRAVGLSAARRFDSESRQTVQGAANFEKSTLTEVTNARASVGQVKLDPNKAPTDAAELEKFQQAQGQLSTALSRLLVVSENYPQLRATEAFQSLQAQLEGTENRISVERNNFNAAVQEYNTALGRFPTNMLNKMFGFQPRPFFTAQTGAEKAPAVNFNFGSSPRGHRSARHSPRDVVRSPGALTRATSELNSTDSMTVLPRLLIGVAIFGVATLGVAETMPSKPDRYFNDYAAVVDQATALQLNEQLAQFERETSTQLLVAIYRTMESESSVADYTQRIAKPGASGKKVATMARSFSFLSQSPDVYPNRLRPGRRAPGRDLFRHHAQRHRAVLQEDDYAADLKPALTAMMQAVRGEYKGTGRTHKEASANDSGGRMPIGVIIFLVIVFLSSCRTADDGDGAATAIADGVGLTSAVSAAVAAGRAGAVRAAAAALAGLAAAEELRRRRRRFELVDHANKRISRETRA